MKEKICLGLNANEIKIPYDKHLKVSSLALAFTVTLKYAVLTGSLALSTKNDQKTINEDDLPLVHSSSTKWDEVRDLKRTGLLVETPKLRRLFCHGRNLKLSAVLWNSRKIIYIDAKKECAQDATLWNTTDCIMAGVQTT